MNDGLPPYLWVLNPDAERELAATHSYAVRAAFVARVAERRALFDALVQGEPTEYAYQKIEPKQAARALFWCPTPRVVRAATEAGLRCGAAPSLEVLRTVHDKRFLTPRLADVTLSGRCNVSSEDEWRRLRASMPGDLRLKRPFGYAGKAQRVWPRVGGEDALWLFDSLRSGGFSAEPQIEGAVELSQHGLVDARGLLLGAPCRLHTTKSGAPTGIQRTASAAEPIAKGLYHICERVAEELRRAGYFGPFGIDALIVDDTPRLIDVNPRFTLGWSVGMGALRAQAIERALELVP